MTQRYAVPEEGLKAAVEKCDRANWGMSRHGIEQALEAFIRWQSENPQVPTVEQYEEMRALYVSGNGQDADARFYNWLPVEWQRRMYLAPEPEAEERTGDSVIITVPKSGRYAVGIDYGRTCGDETAVSIMYIGANGEPDELIETLRRDKGTGRFVAESAGKSALSDLLWKNHAQYDHQPHELNARHDAAVEEAFRRGQNSR